MKRHTNEGGGLPSMKLARGAVMVSQHSAQQQLSQQQQHCQRERQLEQPDEQQRQQPCGESHNNNIGSNRLQSKGHIAHEWNNSRVQLKDQTGVDDVRSATPKDCQDSAVREVQRNNVTLDTDRVAIQTEAVNAADTPKVTNDTQTVSDRAERTSKSRATKRELDGSDLTEQEIGEHLEKGQNSQQHRAAEAKNAFQQNLHKEQLATRTRIEDITAQCSGERTRKTSPSRTTPLCTVAVSSIGPPRAPVTSAGCGDCDRGGSQKRFRCDRMKTTVLDGTTDIGVENGDSSGCGEVSNSVTISPVGSNPAVQQMAQGGQQTRSTPESTMRTSASTDHSGERREKVSETVREREREFDDVREERQSDGDGGHRKDEDANAIGSVYRDRLKLLPINCPEKLVFIVDSSVETGVPCGQFVDGSTACVLDVLKKAMRLLALRRTAMNPSAQVGLVEWGRVPRWRLTPRSVASDNVTLDLLFDKLTPSTANEELCDFNVVLQTIKERTGLSMTWDRERPPFIVRAIVFYCRPTPPPCSTEPLSVHAESHAASESDRVQRQSPSDLKQHPLFTLDAVFVLPKASCVVKRTAPVAAVLTPATANSGSKWAGTKEKADQIEHGESAPGKLGEVEQAQEVVGDADVKSGTVSSHETQQDVQTTANDDVMLESEAQRDNQKHLHIETIQQAQSVFDWLNTLCTPSSYILPCVPSTLQILKQCCRLLGHPLQRPPQHLAQHHIRPVQAAGPPHEKAETGQQQERQNSSSHSQITGGDRESSTESSSTLSRPEDEPLPAEPT